MENKVNDIIIKALEDVGNEVERSYHCYDYDTNNGVSIKVETLL